MMAEDGDFYRYTVRCNRGFNNRIEKAAKEAGVSATTFVQEHFNTILGTNAPVAGRKKTLLRRVNVPEKDRARILEILRDGIGADGVIVLSYAAIASKAQCTSDKTRSCVADLIDEGVIEALPPRGQIAVHRFVGGSE